MGSRQDGDSRVQLQAIAIKLCIYDPVSQICNCLCILLTSLRGVVVFAVRGKLQCWRCAQCSDETGPAQDIIGTCLCVALLLLYAGMFLQPGQT